MTPERLREIEALFHEARERTGSERDAFLAGACADDRELRREVESLLAQPAAGVIDTPIAAVVADLVAGAPRLVSGAMVGPYCIDRLIGVGGMGDVYKARDTRLRRDVAIKMLPRGFTADPERRARFEREARLLAALNHPHIAGIHGLEEADGVLALVLELVEGPTLAARLAAGPLPVREAIEIARQVADALEAAHEKGIVHRDLKPTNIKLTAGGQAKVLDFGLAKALGDGVGSDLSQLTTTADANTLEGVILGTASYMSPEQARGLAVDKRTDIWAFGCVLYELLCGRRAFGGDTVTDALVQVLEREPDWAALPPDLPGGIERLLRHCLERDPKKRLRDIGDALIEIDEARAIAVSAAPTRVSNTTTAVTPNRLRIWLIVAAAILVLAPAAWWMLASRVPSPNPRVVPLTTLPGVESFSVLSPDGTQVAFVWNGGAGDNDDIYVQRIGSETPSRLTTDPAADILPVWSPDGSQVAFLRRAAGRDALFVIAPPGGTEVKIAEFGQAYEPPTQRLFKSPLLSWSPDGRWLAVAGNRASSVQPPDTNGIVLVAADGSTLRMLLPVSGPTKYYESPAFSPGGETLAFAACDGEYQCRVHTVGLGASAQLAGSPRPRRVTTEFEVIAGIAWSEDGKDLIYGAASVWLNTFHLWRVRASGEQTPERVDVAGVAALPSISRERHRLAFSRRTFDLNIWKYEEGHDLETIAASSQSDYDAYFSPDGGRIAFVTDRRGDGSEVWTVRADGTALKSLTKGTQRTMGSPSWSPDGKWLAFDGKGEDGNWRVSLIDAEGGAPRLLAPLGHVPSWSADGRWIYFSAALNGPEEIWRVSMAGGAPTLVTHGGGTRGRVSPDGKTLYFMRSGPVLAMPLPAGPERKVIDAINAWQYAPTTRGIYFVPARVPPAQNFELRFLDFESGKSRALKTIQAAYFGTGLSVSPAGAVLMNGVTSIDVDLMLVENFR